MKTRNSSIYSKLRVLCCLNTSTVVKVETIAVQLGISVSYVEQIVSKLAKLNLVIGKKGSGGGYLLTDTLHSITLGEIITDEYLDPLVTLLFEDYRDIPIYQLKRLIDMRINDYEEYP